MKIRSRKFVSNGHWLISNSGWLLSAILLITSDGLASGNPAESDASARQFVLEDFQRADENGFPDGWEAQRSKATANETYAIRVVDGMAFLEAKNANQRVFKRIAWDPKTQPMLTWRWRIRSVPDEADMIAAVYASLDTDLLVIPVATKYVWSAKQSKGSITEGGIFGATEIVVRSGLDSMGEWVEETVNAYQDFKQVHGHEPASQAWGISILGGPGVEVDFGPLEVHSQ